MQINIWRRIKKMPKISKKSTSKKYQSKQDRLKQMKIEQAQKRSLMFKSTILTYILAAVFFTRSMLFNGRFIELDFGESTGAAIGEVFLKAAIVVLFFFFALISIGNYQEMKGYVATWKELVLLIIISLLMAASKGTVFFASLLGIVLVLTYIYFLQGKTE